MIDSQEDSYKYVRILSRISGPSGVFKMARRSQDHSADYHCRICRAIDFINSHLAEHPTVSEIADAAPFSKHHFQRPFSGKLWLNSRGVSGSKQQLADCSSALGKRSQNWRSISDFPVHRTLRKRSNSTLEFRPHNTAKTLHSIRDLTRSKWMCSDHSPSPPRTNRRFR